MNRFKDAYLASALWFSFLGAIGLFVLINYGILTKGLSGFPISFLIENPERAGREGGVFSIIVSTLWILGICMVAVIPLSLGAAIFLSEFAPRTSKIGGLIGLSLDVLASVPSIVFGLFGNAVFCKLMGLGFSLLSGGLTLACMVAPILTRSIEESLRSVPDDYRMGAAALSLSRTTTIVKVLLPAALPGLFIGLVIGIGRAIGETAALIFTSGYVDRVPESAMDSGRTLAVHIFDLAMNVPGGELNAYRTGLVLLLLILAINSVIALLGRKWIVVKE